MTTDIYIKSTRRKCSLKNGYNCIDIMDENNKPIMGKDCDLIDITYNDHIILSIDTKNGKLRLWTYSKAELEPLINTFIIKLKSEDIH